MGIWLEISVRKQSKSSPFGGIVWAIGIGIGILLPSLGLAVLVIGAPGIVISEVRDGVRCHVAAACHSDFPWAYVISRR